MPAKTSQATFANGKLFNLNLNILYDETRRRDAGKLFTQVEFVYTRVSEEDLPVAEMT